MRTAAIALLFVLVPTLALGGACGGTKRPPRAYGGGPSAADAPWKLKERMAEHFVATGVMRDALVRADLEAFSDAAAVITSESEHGDWGRSDAVREAASRARGVTSLYEAARVLAEIGVACSECHRSRGGVAIVVPGPATDAKSQLTRHSWGAERLWEGLMSPSDDAWKRGGGVLTDAPFATDGLAGKPADVQAQAFALAERAHALGAQAQNATTLEARTKVFAEVYTTCSSCHRLVRGQ